MKKCLPVIEQSGEFEEVNNSFIQEKDGYYVQPTVFKGDNKMRVFQE